MTIDITQFPSFTKQEVALIATLEAKRLPIVSNEEIKSFFPEDFGYVNKLISQLIKKKILSVMKRGVYSVSPIRSLPMGWQLNEFALGKAYFPKGDYYIGSISLFNTYGFIEQLPTVTFIMNPYFSKSTVINGITHKFVKIKPEYMYGITTMNYLRQIEVNVSDKERNMLDFLDCWNFDEAKQSARSIIRKGQCDVDKFIEYAIRFPKIKVRKKAGYVLDKSGIDENKTKPLLDSIKGSSLVAATKVTRKGEIDKKWGLIIYDFQKQRRLFRANRTNSI